MYIYIYVYISIYIYIYNFLRPAYVLGFSDIHQASSASLRFYQIHAMLLTYLSQAKSRLRCMVFSECIHPEVDRKRGMFKDFHFYISQMLHGAGIFT